MERDESSHGTWRGKLASQFYAYGLPLAIIVLATLWLILVGSTWVKADDEYNFNWLDTDKKVYVLQNRKYRKAGHALLSVLPGIGFSNPYKNAYNIEPRLAYYISEAFGIEAFYTATWNASNNTLEALSKAAPNTLPSIREIHSQFGGLIHYVPWYAKLNVFNSIMYFDWYFTAGAGMVQTFVDTRTSTTAPSNLVEQDLFAVMIGTGHQYHLSQSFIVRIDVTAAIYQAPINGLSGDTAWYSNFNFGAGVGWKL